MQLPEQPAAAAAGQPETGPGTGVLATRVSPSAPFAISQTASHASTAAAAAPHTSAPLGTVGFAASAASQAGVGGSPGSVTACMGAAGDNAARVTFQAQQQQQCYQQHHGAPAAHAVMGPDQLRQQQQQQLENILTNNMGNQQMHMPSRLAAGGLRQLQGQVVTSVLPAAAAQEQLLGLGAHTALPQDPAAFSGYRLVPLATGDLLLVGPDCVITPLGGV